MNLWNFRLMADCGKGDDIWGQRAPLGSLQMTLGKLPRTPLEQPSARIVESDITSLSSPLPHHVILAPASKMKSTFHVVREPGRIRAVRYFLILTPFQGSQRAQEQVPLASFRRASTQRSKAERQLESHANPNSLGSVVSKRDTLGCGKEPRLCHPGS